MKLFELARETATPLVFRAGGTSLNGQSQTDSILVDVRRHFQRMSVEADGMRARAQPGIVLGHVNRRLARYGRRLGPDPASTDIACVGGVIANNSGGMRCGVHADSYRTLRSMTFVLASGAVIDTAAPDAHDAFAAGAPELAAGLAEIRDELRADAALCERIARKFEIKNTTGYRLCAFLDADEPLEIFRRLIVGSEGTLAFVAEAVLDTVELGRLTTVALVLFDGIDAAVQAVEPLVAAGASATELMVAPTLIAAAWNMPGTPEAWKELPPDAAALLIEFRSDSDAELEDRERAALAILTEREPLQQAHFTRERTEVEMLWHVREGMQGLLAAIRAPGVQLIIEDVCVPPARVGEAAKDLQALLSKHGFLPGVAGHASAGNLHFLLTPNFGERSDLDRYAAFMEELVDLIVGSYDGSLKAEHGTGLNMAPFVEREWGAKATGMMWRVKQLADPHGILAPGVLLSSDAGAHLRNLKPTPEIEELATKCIECGFCEPACPSRDITTTPRQRIALRREMARQQPGSPVLNALLEQFDYDAIQTCAADGSCALACPVGIDTGALIKLFRARRHGERSERAALGAARRFSSLERSARAGLRVGATLGSGPTRALKELRDASSARSSCPNGAPRCRGPRPRCRAPAETVRLRSISRVREPHLRQHARTSARAEPSAGAGERLCARRAAAVDPAGRRRALLRDAVELEGVHRGSRAHGRPRRCGGARVDPRGRAAAGHRRQLVHLRDARRRRRSAARRAAGALRASARDRLDRVGARSAAAVASDRARAAMLALHTPCAARHLGLAEKLDAIAHALADEVSRRSKRAAAGWRATAACFTRSCPTRRCAPPQRSSTRAPRCRACARTAPARSPSSRSRGAPTRPSWRCSRASPRDPRQRPLLRPRASREELGEQRARAGRATCEDRVMRFSPDRPMNLQPATVLDYRELARRRLPRQLFDYVDGGAYEEATMRANVADLARVLLRQRVMRDVSVREQATEVLGQRLQCPVVLAPVGLAGMFATRAEVQAARAAHAAGVPFIESTVSICPIEEVARATPSAPWFQLYVMRDRAYAEDLMARAQAVGSPVLVLTIDLAVVGARHRDTRNATVGASSTWGRLRRGADLISHPRWVRTVGRGGAPLTFGNLEKAVPGASTPAAFRGWVDEQFDPSVTWDDLAWVREHWSGRLVVKGVLGAGRAPRSGFGRRRRGGLQPRRSPAGLGALHRASPPGTSSTRSVTASRCWSTAACARASTS